MVSTPRRSACPRYLSALIVLTALVAMLGCGQTPTPTPPPRPSPVPTATPGLDQALKDALFTISLDGTLLATEEIRLDRADKQPLVFSEIRSYVDSVAQGTRNMIVTERRTMVLTGGYTPQRYDIELSALGARSIWVAERRGEVMDCLNNNLAWYAPVLVEGVSPAPEVMLESAPSALPFVLLALRYDEQGSRPGAPTTMRLRALDIMEDYPVSRELTVTTAPQRQGAVIGTFALEGQVAGAQNPRFTLWVRPGSRLLYSVEISDYRFGLWQSAAHPLLRRPGKLVIRRVSKLPDAPVPPARKGEAARLSLDFAAPDKSRRSGTLVLPAGNGPFPCLVLHSPSGIAPRWDPGDALAQRGWAAYFYDKRGLGQSEGSYDRDLPQSFAADANAAAAMLSQRPELNPRRIVFMGVGDGGIVGAVAISSTNAYAGAILGSCASSGPLFPNLAQQRVRGALARAYRWTPEQLNTYDGLSVRRWQQWLFERRDEVVLLRRRAPLQALKEIAATDMAVALGQAKVPVLLLHGQNDAWTSVEGARALQTRLAGAGQNNVKLQVFEGLDADLGANQSKGILAPAVDEAIFAWLGSAIAP